MTRSLPTRRAFVALSALSVATVFAPAVVRAGGANAAPLGSVTIAVGGQGVLYHLPLVLADQLGFFREEGLDVVVSDFPAGALAVQAVQSGAADVCVGAFEHTLRQQVSGHAYRSLVVLGRAPQLALGVSLRALPSFKAVADLAGRRIGVSSIGSSTHLAASLVLARAGLAPQAFVQKNAAQAQALANGIVHALKWLQTAAPGDLVKAVPPGYLMGDRGLYLAAFNRVRETYSTNGLMADDGAATALRVLTRVQPELADVKVDLARTYTNDFVRKARQKHNV